MDQRASIRTLLRQVAATPASAAASAAAGGARVGAAGAASTAIAASCSPVIVGALSPAVPAVEAESSLGGARLGPALELVLVMFGSSPCVDLLDAAVVFEQPHGAA